MKEENGGSKREPSSLCLGEIGNSARVLVFSLGNWGQFPLLIDIFMWHYSSLTLYEQETQLFFPLGRQELNCVEEGDAELKRILQQTKNGKNYRQGGE